MLPAANALCNLRYANCAAFVPHIGALADLHAELSGTLVSDILAQSALPLNCKGDQDSNKRKLPESIASQMQAFAPEEKIPLIQAIISLAV